MVGKAEHISDKMFYDALSKNENIFVSKDVFSNKSSRDFIEEIKNSQEKLKEADEDLKAERAKVQDAEQAKNDLDTKLKTANSRAKKLEVVAGLGWIGTLVSLGCVFQNELKNACGTVYKKVLELKNSILG